MSVLLRTEGVHKSYGGVRALDDCRVEIGEGEVAGLIGPNGSGKTTLFNVITGYAKADAGEVYLGDRRITNIAPDKVFALGIGRTFQLTRIFASLTVMENMLVASKHGRASARKRAMEQLEFVGIAGHHAVPGRHALVRAAQAARAGLRPGRGARHRPAGHRPAAST